MYDLMDSRPRGLIDAWTKDRVSGYAYTIVRVNDRVETLIFYLFFYDRKSQKIVMANNSVQDRTASKTIINANDHSIILRSWSVRLDHV